MKNWEELVQLEPRLAELLKEAQDYRQRSRDARYACANEVYGGPYGLRARMEDLVGWVAKTDIEELKTGEAWKIAHHKIYAALPDCRDCSCFFIQELVYG
jgi:hypothetical protein